MTTNPSPRLILVKFQIFKDHNRTARMRLHIRQIKLLKQRHCESLFSSTNESHADEVLKITSRYTVTYKHDQAARLTLGDLCSPRGGVLKGDIRVVALSSKKQPCFWELKPCIEKGPWNKGGGCVKTRRKKRSLPIIDQTRE